MQYEVTKTVTETVDIDLSTPVYRKRNDSTFVKIYEQDGVLKSAYAFDTAFLFNSGIHQAEINLEENWEEATETEFNEGLKKYLAKQGITL